MEGGQVCRFASWLAFLCSEQLKSGCCSSLYHSPFLSFTVVCVVTSMAAAVCVECDHTAVCSGCSGYACQQEFR